MDIASDLYRCLVYLDPLQQKGARRLDSGGGGGGGALDKYGQRCWWLVVLTLFARYFPSRQN